MIDEVRIDEIRINRASFFTREETASHPFPHRRVEQRQRLVVERVVFIQALARGEELAREIAARERTERVFQIAIHGIFFARVERKRSEADTKSIWFWELEAPTLLASVQTFETTRILFPM
mgnify:CR=1 FL=1